MARESEAASAKKRILITGGPVGANLDAVKIITNKFKGGRMAKLAEDFCGLEGAEVVWLATRDSVRPAEAPNLEMVFHNGFDDYRAKALELAKGCDAAILGAAVANLIPMNPWKGKFPSHDYKPGDRIPIDFTIAPRVVDEIREAAPGIDLVAFKLLAGFSEEELVSAAYGIALESGACAVVANDAANLDRALVVTRERAVHPMGKESLAEFLWAMFQDRHWRTRIVEGEAPSESEIALLKAAMAKALEAAPNFYPRSPEGLVFGAAALRREEGGFVCTARGKTETEDFCSVERILPMERIVEAVGKKASLNAPLIGKMFASLPKARLVLHGHVQVEGLPTLPWAPSGTDRDLGRKIRGSFNIERHGCALAFDADGKML